ncbi:WecB/TagA/CpsF family glycosyltransferase [Adlercreutzia sp. ZJ141]|uniref:WecB/TagA/CpsF family glycosyltransferase n=1 Tax=Adlercreutzia sp. ZJ141 TaxID=2709406 RepID=UPI0013EDE0F9|nr:WecB/TagA/CpsF family glycosyltransferase [Adlercreutzia sp. ZJ141]
MAERLENAQRDWLAPNRYPILNSYVNVLSLEETVAAVEEIISRGVPTQHVVINASKVNLMEGDPRLREIVNACPLINADGASIVWVAKRFGVPLKERVTGIDLFLRLVELAAEKGYGIYLFGAKDEVVRVVKETFEERYPGIRIAGCRNGYFSKTDEPDIVADMAASGADMMFVAFSSPKKEYWVHEHLDKIGIPFVMGVGGSFDVVAGVTVRAPKWMQEHGLEWLYRFIQEPGRLWKRYIVGNARFVLLTLKYGKRMKGTASNG